MNFVLRRSNILTILSFIGLMIGTVNTLWLFPAILSAEEIGLYRFVHDTPFLLLPFAQFGLGQSIMRFFSQFKENKAIKSQFLGLICIFTIIGYCLFILFILLFKATFLSFFITNSSRIIPYFPLIILLTFIMVINTLLESWCYALHHTTLPSVIRFIVIRLLIAGTIILYNLQCISLNQLLISISIVYSIELILLVSYLVYLKEFAVSFHIAELIKKWGKKILIYSLYGVIGSTSYVIVSKIDHVMISSMLGLHETGVYSTILYMSVVIEMPKRAIRKIASPLLANFFIKNQYRIIEKIYKQVAIHQFTISLLLFLCIYINIDYIFQLMPNHTVYMVGKTSFLWIGISKLLNTLFSVNSEMIAMSRYYRFNIISILLLAAITVSLNYWLIPIWGINGAAISAFCALTIHNIVKYIFIWYQLKMQPFSKKILYILLVGLTTFLSIAILPSMGSIIGNIIIRLILLMSIYIYLINYLKITSTFNDMISKNIKIKIIQFFSLKKN